MARETSDLPEGIDARLAVGTSTIVGTLYLFGSSHSFPGRMAAYHKDGQWLAVSKSEIETATPEAAAWVDGFLAGSEPPPPVSGDELAERGWDESRSIYRRTGELPRRNEWLTDASHSGQSGLEAIANRVDSADAFAVFLSDLAISIREGSGDWEPFLVERFLLVWSSIFDLPRDELVTDQLRAAADFDWKVLARMLALVRSQF
jgi:hypothetical protein